MAVLLNGHRVEVVIVTEGTKQVAQQVAVVKEVALQVAGCFPFCL